jgi:hypothetical protein
MVLTTTTDHRVRYYLCLLWLVRVGGYISGVQLAQTQRGMFHFRRAAFSAQLKAKVGSTLAKAAAAEFTYQLNIYGTPITSRTHTHPSHSQTSRLLTSSLSLGVPVPRATQCMRDV